MPKWTITFNSLRSINKTKKSVILVIKITKLYFLAIMDEILKLASRRTSQSFCHVIFDRTGEVVFWLMTYFNCSIKIRSSQVRKRPLSDVEMKMVYFWQMGKSMNFYNHAISNLLPLLIVATWLWLSITLKVTESQTNVTVYKCNITIHIKSVTRMWQHTRSFFHTNVTL